MFISTVAQAQIESSSMGINYLWGMLIVGLILLSILVLIYFIEGCYSWSFWIADSKRPEGKRVLGELFGYDDTNNCVPEEDFWGTLLIGGFIILFVGAILWPLALIAILITTILFSARYYVRKQKSERKTDEIP